LFVLQQDAARGEVVLGLLGLELFVLLLEQLDAFELHVVFLLVVGDLCLRFLNQAVQLAHYY